MAERFNVRNVAQKEIYDSYMGILRISPNDGIDDPTQSLKDLNSNGVILSDSNGTRLPIIFKPKVFRQTIYDGSEKPIIHITTNVERTTHASDNLTVRSTLIIKRNTANDSAPSDDKTDIHPYKSSVLSIGSSAQSTGGGQYETKPLHVLHYPVEAPHDDQYFNSDDNFNLYDHSSDTLSHHQQVKEALKAKSQKWYSIENPQIYDHQVNINGKFISTYNNDGEQIPILHTRDYVLGSYDGHSWKKTSDEEDNAYKLNDYSSMATSPFNGIQSFDYVTKLSWLRVDNLIWEALEEILKGDVRHFNGRFNNLGNVSGQIVDGATTKNTSGGSILNVLFNKDSIIDVQKNSPILGQGYQQGLITYNAMPFHRYWFHRCRQALANFVRRREQSSQTEQRKGEEKQLHEASRYGLITKASAATVTPVHSLVKDFLLCNGLEVSFDNFPNINSTNKNLLSDVQEGRPSLTFGDIDYSSKNEDEKSVYNALYKTKISPCHEMNQSDRKHIVLPNLFSLVDNSPRFIRGMDFINYPQKNQFSSTFFKDANTPRKRYYYYSKQFLDKDGKMLKHILYDEFNNAGIPYQKFYKDGTQPLDEVSLHFYNYDFLTPTKTHTHNLFSTNEGGKGNKDNYDICYYYDYDGNDGGNQYKRWTLKNRINRNLLFNNVNYPSDRWWNPTDKVTIKNDTSSHYNFIQSTSNNKKAIKVKGWNSIPWLQENSRIWLDYCFKDNSKQVFYNFTPIPNSGLFLFNGDLYNSKLLKHVLKFIQQPHINSDGKLVFGTYEDENGTEYKIPTATFDEKKYDTALWGESNLTGYSPSVIAASITSLTTKKINEQWKLRNKLFKTLKAVFQKNNYKVNNFDETTGKILQLVYQKNTKKSSTICYYDASAYTYSYNGIAYTKNIILDADGKEKEHWYEKVKPKNSENTENSESSEKIEKLETKSIIKIFDGFSSKLVTLQGKIDRNIQSVKTGLIKTYVDENKKQIKEDILFETPYEGWKTYKWFINNNFPTKSFSKSTLKKKQNIQSATDYISSYKSSIIKVWEGIGCIEGTERGTISDLEYLNWQGYSYYDAQNNRHLFTSLKRLGEYNTDNFNDQTQQGKKEIENFKKEILQHIEQKKKRKMLAMKINESEARIPISYNGKAQFSTRYLYTYERKRSSGSSAGKGDEWDTEQQNFKIKDVGNYIIGQYADEQYDEDEDENKNENIIRRGKFRCLTSLAHSSPQYLAFGNIDEKYDPQKPQTYWNVNNVTDFYKSENSKQDNQKYSTTYGGSKSIIVDTKSPYPTHIKLLPLIRL